MKQRITVSQLNELSEAQKNSLISLWIPNKYDVAVANICRDIINEQYEQHVFAIGDIKLFNGYRMLLFDIKAISDDRESHDTKDSNEDQSNQDASDSEISKEEIENEEDFDGFDENEIDFSFHIPTSFTKDECAPLLNIGQMIEILSKTGSGNGDFYLYADTGEIFSEIGKSANSNDYGIELENSELCDVLWELVKSQL